MDETSQYPPPNAENDDNGDFLEEDDKTQPMEEHLQALRAMDIMNSSQDTDIVDPGPSSQVEAPPSTPPSPYSTVRQRVQTKPTDVDSWLALIRLADDSGDYDRVVETYEALLEVFPNTSTAQIAYIEHVLASQNPSKHATVAGLFNRFLKTSPFVELWKFYLAHVRKMHPDPSTRDTVRKAYEYALNHIGHDKESNEIWTDYIQFLKTGEAVTTWDEGQKMDAIRKAYQRAVQTPMENVKRLWEEYSEFETNLNKQLAKKFLSDLQTSHMQARTVLNTLQEHTNTLLSITGDRHGIWLPHPPTFSAEDKALVARWKQYLKWEESNPLEIEEKDRSQFHSRVQTVYRKALVKMRFFSEIWYMAYAWTLGVSSEAGLPENKRKERRDEALSILKAGIEANPKSFVLNFAYAEVLEDAKNLKEVHATFTKFIDILRSDLEELEATVKAEDEPSQDSNNAGGGVRSNNSSFTTQSSDESGNPSKELKNRRTEYGIAWIVYMRFARRAEMPRSARDVFSKARKDKWTPWEVYEAAALMEYHCTKATDVAMRIFERGLEKFPDEEEFALRYLGFLISINDDSNARALFERVVTTFPPERARLLWERWARYEYQFGNLQAAQNLEKRLSEVYPNDPPIKRFAERHKYLGTDAIAVRDLGFNFSSSRSNGHGSSRSSGNALGRTDTLQSIVSNASAQNLSSFSSSGKRPSSPDSRRREEGRSSEHGPPTKRQKPGSPSRERDRERWDGPPRRRHGSPSWDRDRERDGGFKKEKKEIKIEDKEKEEDKVVSLQPVLSWFVSVLPEPSSFDGPVFRTDDLMQVFRNAVIPSSTGIRPVSPPPAPRAGGRPPPDYGPYQGPNAGRRGRY